jgi:ADP-ribosylglycohydrolase
LAFLFGILALQLDFIGRDALIAGMQAWVLDKAKPLSQILAEREALTDEQVLSVVCTPNEYGDQFQIHTAEAVACALWAFACCPNDPEECIIRAVGLGGDTDTVATMAGALAGSLHGSGWLPRRWFDLMENGPGVGRDYLIDLARRLAKLDLYSVAD